MAKSLYVVFIVVVLGSCSSGETKEYIEQAVLNSPDLNFFIVDDIEIDPIALDHDMGSIMFNIDYSNAPNYLSDMIESSKLKGWAVIEQSDKRILMSKQNENPYLGIEYLSMDYMTTNIVQIKSMRYLQE